ncbi:hypothetical protein BJ875DRAFT_76933 [Amylocarpus encephaloides]|uniref:Rhodopsin domain-containing protein n=1 Tax=Amylocarpus encephaloides TaxID=45428 RepID=A0A9P7YGC7_9HELO|nr:hypothetical protein BJ875DRAFT_76933 [Amylocarpus encephaloides]
MGVINSPRSMDPPNTSLSVALICLVFTFTLTSTGSVILRLVAKKYTKTRLLPEDYTIIAAQFCVYVYAVAVLLQVFVGGAGHHAHDVDPSHVSNFLKILVAVQIIYGITVGLVKISICLFYIRIFFTRPFRLASWIVIGFLVAWSLSVVLNAVLICRPVAANWDPNIGNCANQTTSYTIIGVVDLLTDIAVFILPMKMIWGLQVGTAKRVALFCVFGLGVSTMVLAVMRIITLARVAYSDVTYTAGSPLIWSFLEPTIGVTVACGPLFAPLLKENRHFRSITNKISSKSSKGGDGVGGGSSAAFERLTEEERGVKLVKIAPRGMGVGSAAGARPGTRDSDDDLESGKSVMGGEAIRVKTEVDVSYDEYIRSSRTARFGEGV